MRIVIVGAGETGTTLARRFSERGWDVVLIDVSAAALAEADEMLDVMSLVGNATHRPVLTRAGVPDADAFVAVSGVDAQNILSAALARRLGATVSVARVDDPGFFAPGVRVETELLGVDAVMCTPQLIADQLLNRIMGVHFERVSSFALRGLRVGVLQVQHAPSLHAKPAAKVELPGSGQVMAVLRDGYIRPATEIASLAKDDRVVMGGEPACIARAWSSLIPSVRDARAVVVGGGDVGESLVRSLMPHVDRLELIEIEPERARQLAEDLDDVTVLCGDGRRHAFLEDRQVSSASYLIATTADDESGLLISLLARRLGVPQTFTYIRQPGHGKLFEAIGVEGATGLFDVLSRAAKDSIIVDGIVRTVPIAGTSYDICEWRVARQTNAGDVTTLDAVPLPARCRIVGLAHGFKAVPATPGAPVRTGDSLVILTPRKAIAELERNLRRFDRGRGG